jgi:hypothetical protein
MIDNHHAHSGNYNHSKKIPFNSLLQENDEILGGMATPTCHESNNNNRGRRIINGTIRGGRAVQAQILTEGQNRNPPIPLTTVLPMEVLCNHNHETRATIRLIPIRLCPYHLDRFRERVPPRRALPILLIRRWIAVVSLVMVPPIPLMILLLKPKSRHCWEARLLLPPTTKSRTKS